MASYKSVLNPHTGRLTVIRSDSAFHLKESVPTYNDLPVTGNTENDVRITEDTDKMYTWGIASSSGVLADWKEIGSATSVNWDAITGKPSSTPIDIDDAVSKKHTQNTDTILDEGGANEVAVSDIKDAVDEKHTHSNKAQLDLVTDGDHDVRTDNPHTVTKSQIGLNNVPDLDTTDAVNNEHTHANKALLDTYNQTNANITDAVSKKHTQGTDENIILDSTPDSDHTASGIKTNLTAGEALVFGDVCYVANDEKMMKGDASAEATSMVIAIALESISSGASGEFLLIGIVRDDTWTWTVGSPVYLSTTTGALTQTAPSGNGEIVQVLGIATHADRIYFKPDLVQVEVSA